MADAGKDSFILHDNYRALVADFSGNVEGVIDRKGRGPGEYNVIQDIFYDDESGSVFLFDPTEKDRLINVSTSGELVNTVTLPQRIKGITEWNGELYVQNEGDGSACFSTAEPGTYSIVRDSGLRNGTGNLIFDLSHSFLKDGENLIFVKACCDTLYRVSGEGEEPFIFMDMGSKGFSREDYTSRERYSRAEAEKISVQSIIICRDRLFLELLYDSALYYQIWDISTQKLEYQHRITSEDGGMGFPVSIGGEDVYMWPCGSAGGRLICVRDAEADGEGLHGNGSTEVICINIKEKG